ncbi:Xaa-Pro aminopeptidase [hydrothermal vent metagenome]|uniref:Xaa-Pro aminopeptidase n=1 Tax=hydrothermal vent metagenome TaxID=652676 RepID=A0A3B0S7L2_9ZZZZ
MTTIVFLHIPKTAGQTIHHALAAAVGGGEHVSPIRTQEQAAGGPQMPAGYRLYSGHIDWVELETLPADRFVFSVLRDPKERIASFYFFLLKEARAMSAEELELPANFGKRQILEMSADEYFFGGDAAWQNFVRDYYDNFYCSYFATRKMRGRRAVSGLPRADLIARARAGAAQLNGIYATTGLARLESDLTRLGLEISVANIYHNRGDHVGDEPRWPKLLALFERDGSAAGLAQFAEADAEFMRQVLPD